MHQILMTLAVDNFYKPSSHLFVRSHKNYIVHQYKKSEKNNNSCKSTEL